MLFTKKRQIEMMCPSSLMVTPPPAPKKTKRECHGNGTKSKRQRLAAEFHSKFMNAKSVREACEIRKGDTLSFLWDDDSPFEHWKFESISGTYTCEGVELETMIVSRGNKRITVCLLDIQRALYPKENDAIFTWWIPYENESEEEVCVEQEEDLEQSDETDEEDEENEEEEDDKDKWQLYPCMECKAMRVKDCFSRAMNQQPISRRSCLWCTTGQKPAVVVAPPPIPEKVPFKNVGSYKNDGWCILGKKEREQESDGDSTTSVEEE